MVLAKTALFCFRFSFDILQSRCDKVKQAPTRYPPLHPPPFHKVKQGPTRSDADRQRSVARYASACGPTRSHKVQQGPTSFNKLQQASTSFNKLQQASTSFNKLQQGPTRSNKAQQIPQGSTEPNKVECSVRRPRAANRGWSRTLCHAAAECSFRGPRAAGRGGNSVPRRGRM